MTEAHLRTQPGAAAASAPDADMADVPPAAASGASSSSMRPRADDQGARQEGEPPQRRARLEQPAEADVSMREINMLTADLAALGIIANGDPRTAIAEIFGPGRFTSRASSYGLEPGLAMDLRTGYDFRAHVDREQAREQLRHDRPVLLVGSPTCKAFSQIQSLNDQTRPSQVASWEEGIEFLEFCCELYKEHISRGGLILHEHPANASSWGLWMIREVAELPGMQIVEGDQCAYGAWGVDTFGAALIKAPTKWMTNCPEIAEAVSRRCEGGHRHCNMVGNRDTLSAKERYPVKLVAAIFRALRRHL